MSAGLEDAHMERALGAGRAARLTPNTGISVALVITVVLAALSIGRQLQRLDSVEAELRGLRAEMNEVRTLLVRQAAREH